MTTRRLTSCENCWFNPLQNGSVGLSLGYCTEHRVTLRDSSATTCGRHFRKDLSLASAENYASKHRVVFPNESCVQDILRKEAAEDPLQVTKDTKLLRTDEVGELAADYGQFDGKISTLSELRRPIPSRKEFACLNLGRSYVYRCKVRGGAWTSGLNILWWVKKQLPNEPTFVASDFRYSVAGNLARQEELAAWSLLVSRLLIISDVARNSVGELHSLEDLPQRAAVASENLSPRKLMRWIKSEAILTIDRELPESRYRSIMDPIINGENGN
ncbi:MULTISPECIES: hypothetical protein [Stenotrophomonas]|uniref:hypothetical protein n=1 Tax=Stenotrophomonas TaxID=40323 RepID=UPI0013050D1B|nr:hypothetical protein [Stenotrophomonas maltophilia]MBH1680508.1 hypothetical protein [Stenotrophomonas maltophilia]MBH1873282.1 hypothetical protein [Stenotrophomonas maltophilia]